MYVTVRIIESDKWGINISKRFLDQLLTEGYQLGDKLFIIGLVSPYNNKIYYYPVLDICDSNVEAVFIPSMINANLNLVEDMFIDADVIGEYNIQGNVIVTLQAMNETVGNISDIADKLTVKFKSMRVINVGDQFEIEDEPIIVRRILNTEQGTDLDHIITVTVDQQIKITLNFMETMEAVTRKEAEQHRMELEAKGFIGEGHRLGNHDGKYYSNPDLRRARIAKLDKSNK